MPKLSKTDVENTIHLSSSEAAKELGVDKSSINRARRRFDIFPSDRAITDPGGYSFEQRLDGTIYATGKPSDAPVTLQDAYDDLVAKDVDISAYDVSYGFTERELADGRKVNQYTVRAVPKKGTVTPKLNVDELLAAIDGFQYEEVGDELKDQRKGVLVVCPSDMQIGKTDYEGGTQETVNRVMKSIFKIVEFAKKYNPETILIAELGDPIENFYNTSSQRETNDLDLTSQVRVARRLLLEVIKALTPVTNKIIYAAIPSNHGSVKVGFKAPAGNNHNDWGLEILEQLRDVCENSPALAHVEFVRPDKHQESMTVQVGTTRIGMVHGHQSRGADKVGEWWKGQDHGRMPTWDADILLAGHWHSARAYQSGDGRWVVISATSDPGSSWFTNLTGESSKSGIVMFTTQDGTMEDFRVV